LTEPFGQGQQVGQVPAGLLAAFHVSGRERREQLFHSCLDADIVRSALESEQSPHGDVRSFAAELRGDPYNQDSLSGQMLRRIVNFVLWVDVTGFLSDQHRP
jgi:hypothetical protein